MKSDLRCTRKQPFPEGNRKFRPGAGRFLCFLLALALVSPTLATPQSVFDLPRDQDTLCLVAPYERATSPTQETVRALMKQIVGLADEFPTLVENLQIVAPAICLDERKIGDRGYYDVVGNVIGLKSELAFWEKLAVLLHELRHLEQLVRGYCPSLEYSMKENARATFAIEADAQAIATLIAWAMKVNGTDGPWLAMKNWPHYADVLTRFETVMHETDDPGMATAAAFGQWYASPWRIETYYLASCSDYLDRLDQTKLLVSDDLLPGDFLDDLCKMPEGSDYDCIEP